jgi:formate hydrogenlyase subunit 4
LYQEAGMILPNVLLQILQVLCVLLLAPLLQGFILKAEERVQRSYGPSVLQPYRDLWKFFHKQSVVPESASWIYFVAPVIAFSAMLIVPILIPVLTDRPLPLSDMGDMLGGGMVLTLGSFIVILAGLDTGNVYGGIGASRSVMLAILAEPTLILVLVGISLLAKAMLPFVVNHLLLSSASVYWSPAHLFLILAFFALLLVETDRLPVHSSTHIEIYMIDEARILEYSGPLLGLLKWASMMKQFILYTIFCNVFLLPWGMSQLGTPFGEFGSVITLLLKFLFVALTVIVVETVQSRLRFYRYQEPLAAGFLFAVLAIVSSQML